MLAGEIGHRESQLRILQVELPALRERLTALDTTMEILNSAVRPDAAGVVHAWAGRYGKRGAFTEFILGELQAAGLAGIDTVALALKTAAAFHVSLPIRKDFTEFRRNVVLGTLRWLLADGAIETVVANRGCHAPSVWRCKQLLSLDELARRAARAPVSA